MPKKRKLDEGDLQALTLSDDTNHAAPPLNLLKQKKSKSKDTPPCTLVPRATAKVHGGDGAYIIDLASTSCGNTVAAASDKGVTLFAAREGGLAVTGSHSQHTGPTTALCFAPGSNDCVESCGGDGTVLGWDARQKKVAYRLLAGGKHQLNCLDSSDNLVAAGANGSVLFWDRRAASSASEAQPMAEFGDTHEQEVTQVCFHPEDRGNTFLSASTDGLISVFDIAGNLDEDDGFKGALNLMDSVAGMGFYGKGGSKLWCRSHTESLYLWDWSAACTEDSPGGEGPLASMTDARAQLSKAHAGEDGYDFLIGCHADPSSGKLSVEAGGPSGDVAVFPLKVTSNGCKLRPASFLLPGGHTEVVRRLLWNGSGSSASRGFTGGEDGKLAAWSE